MAAVIAAVALALLVTACGGSNGPGVVSLGSSSAARSSTPSSSASTSPLAFAQCMRSHSVPNYPDPDGDGALPKETAQQLGVSDSQYQTAQTACAPLLPNSGGLTPAEVQQEMSALRQFAQCMRSHAVSNWPDPSTDSEGGPIFYLQGEIDENAPQIVTDIHACQHLIPPGFQVGGTPGGVPMCPGERPGPDARSACGGPNQGG